jgi:hypothetical protein
MHRRSRWRMANFRDIASTLRGHADVLSSSYIEATTDARRYRSTNTRMEEVQTVHRGDITEIPVSCSVFSTGQSLRCQSSESLSRIQSVSFSNCPTVHYLPDCQFEREARRGDWILRRCLMERRIKEAEHLIGTILCRRLFKIRIARAEHLLSRILINHVLSYRIESLLIKRYGV